jgi:hypothetical protein
VCGQTNNTDLTNSAEIYDPGTGAWTVTGSMITARALASVTLLPNRTAMVAGGANLAFGSGPSSVLSSAEIYQ